MGRAVFRRYRQHTDEIVPISHDVQAYLDYSSSTLTTAAAANIDTGLTVGSEVQTSEGWSALISATDPALYSFELWLTFSNGSRQVLEFWIDVVNS